MYGVLTNDASDENIAQGSIFLNQAYRQICSVRPWYWLEADATTVTVASQQAYALPYDYDKLISTFQTVGAYKYVPREIVAQIDWEMMNVQTQYKSNYPVYFHVWRGNVEFWPIPSTDGQVISYRYRKNVVDLTISDVTDGTVTTDGTETVMGSGTSWNSSMVGMYFQVPQTGTAGTDGNGFWFRIASVASATSLTLDKAYPAPNVTAANYVIGQVPAIPEPFQDIIAYKAAQQYFLTRNPDNVRVQNFKMLYDEKWEGLLQDSKKTANVWVVPGSPQGNTNPNNYYILPPP